MKEAFKISLEQSEHKMWFMCSESSDNHNEMTSVRKTTISKSRVHFCHPVHVCCAAKVNQLRNISSFIISYIILNLVSSRFFVISLTVAR